MIHTKILAATAATLVSTGAAFAVPLTFDFTTSVDSVFDLDTFSVDNTNPVFGTSGTANLSIDSADIVGGTYFATGNEFTMTHDFGSGEETFTGADDNFGAAFFEFNAANEIIAIFFDVADDNFTTLAVEDTIAEPTIVDFSVIGGDSASGVISIEAQVSQTNVIPLPASGFLLLGGLAGLVATRRRKS
jgi:hypothetical protein